ncbi:hypothetical protein [Hyphomonas sp. KY3]|jgi:hypothetical protein|uniref:hypothetical protein n=1 Tax=Hyphomonas sp. KY3 TaxID=2016196 RepID=UPI001A8ECC1F|nr:hypothetical protein [Hyphomonas sp. KY3]QSR22089.1 hypothetical protein CFA77_07245 [Hyphomonas sp. KY3]
MLILPLLVGLLAGCATHQVATSIARDDFSIASKLFSIEQQFEERKSAGDAVGMARSAKARLELLDLINQPGAVEGIEGQSQISRRWEAIETGAFEMVRAARALAQNDPDTRSRIERIFPQEQMAQSGGLGDFSGLIGERRAVKVTIGLEIDAMLDPNVPERLQLPVDGTEGTTIYVQPVGRHYAEIPTELSMRVKRSPVALDATNLACSPRAKQGRLTCYVAPGDHSGVEISLTNHTRFRVPVLIFVSGNAASVTTALTQE